MDTLIVYYSFTHNNDVLAKALQQRLGFDAIKIETVKKRSPFSIILDLLFHRTPAIRDHELPLVQYSKFILIAPIWAGKVASPMRAFLQREKSNIRHYAFITVCGGGQKNQAEKIRRELTGILECAPRNITELPLCELQAGVAGHASPPASAQRFQPQDLEKFRHKIDAFVAPYEALAVP